MLARDIGAPNDPLSKNLQTSRQSRCLGLVAGWTAVVCAVGEVRVIALFGAGGKNFFKSYRRRLANLWLVAAAARGFEVRGTGVEC